MKEVPILDLETIWFSKIEASPPKILFLVFSFLPFVDFATQCRQRNFSINLLLLV